jgi:hypothetical protein
MLRSCIFIFLIVVILLLAGDLYLEYKSCESWEVLDIDIHSPVELVQ